MGFQHKQAADLTYLASFTGSHVYHHLAPHRWPGWWTLSRAKQEREGASLSLGEGASSQWQVTPVKPSCSWWPRFWSLDRSGEGMSPLGQHRVSFSGTCFPEGFAGSDYPTGFRLQAHHCNCVPDCCLYRPKIKIFCKIFPAFHPQTHQWSLGHSVPYYPPVEPWKSNINWTKMFASFNTCRLGRSRVTVIVKWNVSGISVQTDLCKTLMRIFKLGRPTCE